MNRGWDIGKANAHAGRRGRQTDTYGTFWQRLRALLPRIDWSL